MSKPYSMDLRECVVGAVEGDGVSRRQAAERFGISVSTAVNWVRRYRETGGAGARQGSADDALAVFVHGGMRARSGRKEKPGGQYRSGFPLVTSTRPAGSPVSVKRKSRSPRTTTVRHSSWSN